MLSRVAESLYWIGRYLERAENVNRLLLVTTEVAVEIEGEESAIEQSVEYMRERGVQVEEITEDEGVF